MMRTALVLSCGLLILYAAGCDTLNEPGTITLQAKEATFRFEFSADQMETGVEMDVVSENQADLTDELRADGFTPAEVLAARVTGVELIRVQPLSVESLQFLDRATVELRSGSQSVTVASQSTFPASTRADLSVSSGTDVAGFVRQPPFRAVLSLVPDEVVSNAQYVLEVRVRFSIDVEGV